MFMSQNIIVKGSYVYLRIKLNTQIHWYFYDSSKPPLGAGAMGTVYLGYSCDDKQPVAIKKVKEKFANIPEIRKRAHMEAAMMFRHRNLVEMLGCCEVEPNKGPIFIISNFVRGVNLDDFIQSQKTLFTGPLRVRKICEMMYPIMDVLDYIHSYDIVHMDIKPSNIMVEKGNNIRLMDLGISSTQQNLQVDASMAMIGTPKYAAPEQFGCDKSGQSINITTDIYALGITIYEMLTDSNPFAADNLYDAVTRRRTTLLPYVNNVPDSVVDVLRKAVSYMQEDRYKSASVLKNALRMALVLNTQKNREKNIVKNILTIVFLIILISIIIVTITLLV